MVERLIHTHARACLPASLVFVAKTFVRLKANPRAKLLSRDFIKYVKNSPFVIFLPSLSHEFVGK